MNKTKLPSKVYRAKQVAEITGISLATVWKYSKDKLLTPIHVTPRVTVFDAKEVHKLFGIA
jgi:predicted DNA-binding transcriptional regulator AlpA